MRLPEICVKRPVLAVVINAVLVLCGLLSIHFLPIEFQPSVFQPVLSVRTSYPGASAEVVQREVTQRVVSSVSGIENLESIDAASRQGSSTVDLNFGNITQQQFITAQSEVMRQVARLRLPDSVDAPNIRQSGSRGQRLMFIGFSDPNRSVQAIASYLDNTISKQFQQIPGIGDVDVFASSLALRISLKPDALTRYDITPQYIVNQLQKFTQSTQAGQLLTGQNVYTIDLANGMDRVADYQNLIIKKQGNTLIRLKDLADISLGSRSLGNPAESRVNGQQGVVMALNQSATANPIDVADRVKGYVDQLNHSLPSGMKAQILLDFAAPLKSSLYSVMRTIFEATILVALVCLAFLGRWRAALVPIVALPVCLLSVFLLLWPLGFSINMMTLLALVLSVGLVVDDAIVVLENCYRYINRGYDHIKAAVLGSNEIAFAVIGMSLTLIAVYLPLLFMDGTSAAYFQAFAFTLAVTVIFSAIVALTLSPMMCGHMLGKDHANRYENWINAVLLKAEAGYRWFLGICLQLRYWIVIIFLGLVAGGYWLFVQLPQTLQPRDTIGVVAMRMHLKDHGTTQQAMDKLAHFAGANDQDIYANRFSFAREDESGQISGFSYNILNSENIDHADAIANKINHQLQSQKSIGGHAYVVPLVRGPGGGSSDGFEFYLLNTQPYDQLFEQANQIVNVINQIDGVSDARVLGAQGKSAFSLRIDYEKAALLGVDPREIQSQIAILFGGKRLSQDFQTASSNYPIIVQLPRAAMKDFGVLSRLYVPTEQGKRVSLSRLVDYKPVVKQSELRTYNQTNAVEFDVSLTPNAAMGDVMKTVESTIQSAIPGSQVSFLGSAKDFLEGNSNMMMMLIAGILFIYLILAALFESFLDPFIILLTVPLCIVGGMVGLILINGQLNLYTQIGLITLIGLIAKHGVLIVQFANQLLSQGNSLEYSILHGAARRLRPIIMTSVTMILGALPLLYSGEFGINARQQIGMVIIFGMLLGSLFSLIIVPVAYYLMKKSKKVIPET